MRHVWTDVHQVCNALTALALGIAFEQLTHLEEQHDEDGFGKLRLGSREEPDAKGTDGGHRHEEMLIEDIAVGNTFNSLMQGLVTYYNIR